MNKLEKYIGEKVAIWCKTEQQSLEINKLIVELGGRDLHYYYSTYKEDTCYILDDIKYSLNCFRYKSWCEDNNLTIIPAEEILTTYIKHTFKSGLTVEGTKEEVKLVAKAIGESISPIYKSSSKGDVPVDEMNEIHLRNAILLHLRDYFTQKNFKNMDNESFIDNVEEINDDVIKMLMDELKRRVEE